MLTTVRTANLAQPIRFSSRHEPHRNATVWFVGDANRHGWPRLATVRATVCHGSPKRRGSCGKQTAVVRDIILIRFSDMFASCAGFTSHINPPSPFFSHTVILSHVFHSPSIQTRRCPIHSRHSHSFLTPFAFTHAAFLAEDRIALTPHIIASRLHMIVFSPPLFSLRIHTHCCSRIRSYFHSFFTPLAFRPAARLA